MLQAKLLGHFEIHLDDQPIILPSRTAQSFFAFLLLHPYTSHRREMLAGQFWPNSSETNARNNLRHALWCIRSALGSGSNPRIQSDDLGITYHPQLGDQLDADAFESCSNDKDSPDALMKSEYHGALLPGFYEEWVMLERERLQAVFEHKLGKLLDRLLVESRWNDILEWGELWIASGTTPEPAYRALMMAQAALGNLPGAAFQYQRCTEALARELGVEPSEQTRHTYERIREGRVESPLLKPSPSTATISIPSAFLEKQEKSVPVFVARESELKTLEGYTNKTLQGQLRVVFVSGEAGSGKSALLQEFMRRSLKGHPDLVVGLGICNAFFGQGVPYLPFRDVLNMLAGGIEPLFANGAISREQAIHLIASFPLVVQTIVEQGPGLLNNFLSASILSTRVTTYLSGEQPWRQNIEKSNASEPLSDNKQDQSQLFEQYSQVLRTIACQHPLLIMLDDLQWMDPGTGQLLFHLIRRLQDTRILIVGAYRSEDIAVGREGERHPLESILNEFQSSFGKIIIDLDKDREISGRNFIDSFLDTEPNRLLDPFRQELFQRTQGNPLFTIELLQNLQERGEIFPDEHGLWITATHMNWGDLPPQMEGVIGERIGRLDKELYDLLLTASVEGEQFTVQVLEQVQGKPERFILRQLSQELEKRHHLVQELGETYIGGQRLRHFRFIHSLIQQYLYHQLGAAERAEIHQEVAEALELLYKGDISLIAVPLARHYCEAGIREKAVEYLLLAGDQARNLYAHQEAIDHYQQALLFLKEMGDLERTARTLMKLYLVYHSNFDFMRAQQTLQEYNSLWRDLTGRNPMDQSILASTPYRLATLKDPLLDPAMNESLFDLEWCKELFCGLVGLSEDRNVIPLASKHWEVLDGGRRYIFHLRQDLLWSDGISVTASDFEFAWKRVLDPATQSRTANLLYDILGAKDYHEGRAATSEKVGIKVTDPFTLEIELEEPCGYFPYLLGDPVYFAVPKHVVEQDLKAWTDPGRMVTNGPFLPVSQDPPPGKTIHIARNTRYSGIYKGNIEHITLSFYKNELEIYKAFVAGKLDMAEFLIPPIPEDQLKHYRELGQLHISNLPFVDALYFMVNRPPFDNPDIRRAFVLATDREKLALEIENQIPATGGYIPPDFPGHSPGIGLPYDPQGARRILSAAGYPQGHGFPSIGLLLGLVGLEKGDTLVFNYLQEMWAENLGVTIRKCWNNAVSSLELNTNQDFHFFFVGWLADYPDPASFLQTNYMLDQTQWLNPTYSTLVEAGRHTLEQDKRLDLYRKADHILIEEAVVQPLFYGHICELRQPWVHKLAGSSIYSIQWKDITLIPH
jgi:oligopeptide transport system substrate-binding protein